MLSTKQTELLPQVSQSHTEPTDSVCLTDSGGGIPTFRDKPKNHNKTRKLTIATWNVKTLLDPQHQSTISTPRRTAVIARELKRYQIDIASLQETHLKNSGQLEEINAGYTYLWSGCEDNDPNHYGVAICVRTDLLKKGTVTEPCCFSDRIMSVKIIGEGSDTTFIACYAPTLVSDSHTIDSFYQELGQIIDQVPNKCSIILAGDFNARVGRKQNQWEDALGPHGTGFRNENGLRLLNLCTQFNLRLTSSWFQQKDKYKTTWQHPRTKQWHQIDHIIVRSRDHKNILRCKSMRGAECETDHHLVRVTMKVNLRRQYPQKKPHRTYFDAKKLKTDITKARYQSSIEASYNVVQCDSAETTWKKFKESTVKAALETLGKRKAKRRDWFDESDEPIEQALAKKREEYNKYLANPTTKQRKKYVAARKNCQKEVRRIKEKWWTQKTDELQSFMNANDTFNLYRAIKETVGPAKKSLNIIETKEGTCLKSKAEQLVRWKEHFDNLLNQDAQLELQELQISLHQKTSSDLIINDEPPTEAEIVKALSQLKNNKSPGEDLITAELLKGGEHITVNILHLLFDKIWSEKTLPEDWKHSTVVPIHKKGSKRKCDNFRGISLLAVTGKLLSRILYNRIFPLIESYIDDTQCGFRGGHSTIDMVFAARQTIEKTLEQDTHICIAFVDISKAFDSVNRDALFKILEHIKCPPNILSILKLLHQNTTSSVLIDGESSESFEVRTGVKQGCVLAPALFLLYIQAIINKAKETVLGGINLTYRTDTNMFNRRGLKSISKVNTTQIRELMFADDAALIEKTPEKLQSLVSAFADAAKSLGLNVNVQKTEVMFVNCPSKEIKLNGQTLKEVDVFKYLGSKISRNGDITCEVKNRINAANQAFAKLYIRVWKPHHLCLKTKIQIYKTIVLSTLLYSSECWTLKSKHLQELNAFHLRCLRSLAQISWKDMIPNEEVLRRTNMLKIDEIIRTRRLRWAGHISRMSVDRIPHQIAFSQLSEGTRRQQKPKKRWTDLIKNDLKLLNINEKSWRSIAADRKQWRIKINEKIQEEHENTLEKMTLKRQEQHEEQDKWNWKCPLCDFNRDGQKGRQYVNSHISQSHKDQVPARNNSLICEHCGHQSKTKSGLSSHLRHRHPDIQSNALRPIRTALGDDIPTSSNRTQLTQQSLASPPPVNDQLSCPGCGRICKSKAGLQSHLRGASCRGAVQSGTTSSR
ncbi:hypothetical protein WDU94_005521 [Cyamophila willieti]